MFSLDWQLAAAIATVFSSIAFAISAIAVMLQLRQMARERYFSVTAHLFEIWQSPEFQRDQLFLLHEMPHPTWESFCASGRGKRTERAIHRIGGYYDRVGNLVRHNLIRKEEILPTIGGYAVAVWYRIEPLVRELRLRENAVLFQNYESLLPECHDCYVPALARPSETDTPSATDSAVRLPRLRETVAPAPSESPPPNGTSMVRESPTIDLNFGSTIDMATENTIANSPTSVAPDFALPDSDGIARRLSEFTALGPAVVVYARGAWCPFCLRQLSDYADRYSEFKRSGVEVVALSPESQRKSRRLRQGLKLPFAVLSDAKFEAAKGLGLPMDQHWGGPTPATIMVDRQRRVRLSTLNQEERSLLARDVLEYARAMEQGNGPAPLPPSIDTPKPGLLFVRAIMNMALGVVSR